MFVSITRLRIRAWRFMPSFFLHAFRSQGQVRRTPGFRLGAVLPDSALTFWTMTGWDSEGEMRAYMTAGAHREAMTKLVSWCDEASVVHWRQEGDDLPSWSEAAERMRKEGRPSRVRHPSPNHQGLIFLDPNGRAATALEPAR